MRIYPNRLKMKAGVIMTNFWQDQLAQRTDAFVIKGEHYRIGSESDPKKFKGMGGAKHIIQVKNGERIVTTNLWHQGTVPEEYREVLPDNASFVKQIEIQYKN